MDAVVAGALVQDHRVLLGHRSPSRRWYPDVWDLPGGHVERGESELDALVREMHEELGVHIVASDCQELRTLRLPAGDGDGELRLSVWSVRRWAGTPVNRSLEEHDELRWFSGDELTELSLAHSAYQDLLGDLIRRG